MPLRLAVPIASPGPLAGVIGILGFLVVVAWIAWRFGPTLSRVIAWCSLWVAWACGSQGGYGYCIAFMLLGTLAWGGGTVWYAPSGEAAGPRRSRRAYSRVCSVSAIPSHTSRFPPIAIVPRHRGRADLEASMPKPVD